MQFRVQGKQLQMIRSVYDSAKKRCIQHVIHTVPSYTDKISSDYQIDKLTDSEKEELSAYFVKKSDKKLSDSRENTLNLVEYTFSRLTDAISSSKLTKEQSANIWAGLSDVQKTMKKAGYSKPKPVKPSVDVHPGQADLIPESTTPSSYRPGELSAAQEDKVLETP